MKVTSYTLFVIKGVASNSIVNPVSIICNMYVYCVHASCILQGIL